MTNGILKIRLVKPSKEVSIPVIENYSELVNEKDQVTIKKHFTDIKILIDSKTGETYYEIKEEKEFLGIGDPFLIRYQRPTTQFNFDSVTHMKQDVAAFRERPELLKITNDQIREQFPEGPSFEESLQWKFVGFDNTYSVAVFRNSKFVPTEGSDLTALKNNLGGKS
jgi:hypothetical protein